MARRAVLGVLLTVVVCFPAWAILRLATTGPKMSQAAMAYLKSLDDQQRAKSTMAYDSPERLKWHFIPKDTRKGLQIRDMTPAQCKAAYALLESALSEMGYRKSRRIMNLERLLHELEKDNPRNIRDPLRYYFTVFGEPSGDGRWGLSIEGHHLSLNFVVDKNKVVSSTPTFFASNPALVMAKVPNTEMPRGVRVLAREELQAFQLLHSLNDKQRKQAIIEDKAPREIRAAGEAQPPTDAPVGLAYTSLDRRQSTLLYGLVAEYARNLPSDLARGRLNEIEAAGWDKVHFAWAGADRPGMGHYYRIQGPTFLIELVNTQPDAAGNPANHVHCVWRDIRGDFALPIGG